MMRISGHSVGPRALLAAFIGLSIGLFGGCARVSPAVPAGPEPDGGVRIGYGSSEWGAETGAISSLTEDQIESAHYSTMGETLWGRVPGLEVRRSANGGFTLRIRGVSSLTGAEPLLIVDGVPLEASRDLWSINPRDIQRIDVLKDGSTTAIYGARGANGVIVVTTKRPG